MIHPVLLFHPNYLPLKIDLNVIAKNLRIIRKKHNLTQKDVAKSFVRLNKNVVGIKYIAFS